MPGTDGPDAELDPSLNLGLIKDRFEASQDFTVAIEEEFAIVDPETYELVDGFEDLRLAAAEDDVLADSVAGELIASEIEIRSGRSESFAELRERQQERRVRLFALAEDKGVALAAAGTHPWADYLDQRIIDTPHYQRLQRELGWVAQRNNTWSVHLHMGIRGADRAIAVCDHLRGVLPTLLAASANSPFLDEQDTGLHSVRTEIFTRTFPRCGIPDAFGGWEDYASFVDMLRRTRSIVESTQLWWSIRPHHAFGTVEVRICDAQSSGDESFQLTGLIGGCIAQAALDYDEDRLPDPQLGRQIEENLWRAIRYGLDGRMIDFDAGEEIPARSAVERLVEWTAPARDALGIDVGSLESNGAQRLRAAVADGSSIRDAYALSVSETARTYAPERVAG
ncbi:MAG: carboxylate-amine ligase [Solirubrobacterales bacterium]